MLVIQYKRNEPMLWIQVASSFLRYSSGSEIVAFESPTQLRRKVFPLIRSIANLSDSFSNELHIVGSVFEKLLRNVDVLAEYSLSIAF
jgi:hypothetical protein